MFLIVLSHIRQALFTAKQPQKNKNTKQNQNKPAINKTKLSEFENPGSSDMESMSIKE